MGSAKSQDVNWPNFFVVGAAKGGTSSVYAHLKRHPEVFLPSVKEPAYFSPGARESVDLDRYRELYAGAAGYKAVGDVSPFYFPDEKAPGRIRAACPAAKIVIILRDPVQRAYSHYLFHRRFFGEPASCFREALRRYENRSSDRWWMSQMYVEYGLYDAAVRRYFDAFGRDRVLILLFDDLEKNQADVLRLIAEHIGVDPGYFVGMDVSEASNQYNVARFRVVGWAQRLGVTGLLPAGIKAGLRPLLLTRRKPPLDDESRRLLQDLYDADLTRLEELLGRKIPELRKSWV